jgi:hypothetical protein
VGIVRTSASRLTTQRIRVYRRNRNDDGMSGSYQTWTSIVARYWVHLWPAQHQPRGRQELGEIADTTHHAIGDRTTNGMSIMVGDLFHDEVNNECYDVRGVVRPGHGSTRNAMIRYHLRIVKDGCPEGVS